MFFMYKHGENYMGCADFYLNIYLEEKYENKLDFIINELKKHNIFSFRFSKLEDGSFKIYLFCLFDNFLPTNIIIYNIFGLVNDGGISIETNQSKSEFSFKNDNEYLTFIYSEQKTRMMFYYQSMNYLGIEHTNYYKNRYKRKYKKLYHKFTKY